MPLFDYTAKKSPSETVTGQVEANSYLGAVAVLEERGLLPVSIEEKGALSLQKADLSLSSGGLIALTRDVAYLMKGGVSLFQSFQIIASQGKKQKLKHLAKVLGDHLQEGLSLSETLKKFPGIFSRFYVSIVNAGETSGELPVFLNRLALHMERNQSFQRKIISALAYPALLLAMMGVAACVLVLWVIPSFQTLFNDMGARLPWSTRVILEMSQWGMRYGWFLGILFLFAIVAALQVLRKEEWRMLVQGVLLKTAGLRELISALYLSDLFQSLSTLIQNGVSATDALRISSGTLSFLPYKKALESVVQQVTDGAVLSAAFQTQKIFPESIATLIRVGEESGDLESALERLAEGYSDTLARVQQWVDQWMSPLMILLLAPFVASLILSMLLPLLELDVSF